MLCLPPTSLKRRAPNDLLTQRSRSPPAQRVRSSARPSHKRRCFAPEAEADAVPASRHSLSKRRPGFMNSQHSENLDRLAVLKPLPRRQVAKSAIKAGTMSSRRKVAEPRTRLTAQGKV